MPRVSVIIPVYNTEKFIEKCLDSVCNQTLSDIEIICINDASTDNSLEILKHYASQDNRIQIINFEENKGAAVARNTGIDAATGEYIGFVDSDDFVDLDFYEKLYDKAAVENADVAKGNIVQILENGAVKSIYDYDINDEIKINKAYFYHSFTSAIYKKKVIDLFGIKFPDKIFHFEDPYFSIVVAIHCNKILIEDRVNYYYLKNSTSETSRLINAETIDNIHNSIKLITDYLNKSDVSSLHYNIVKNFIKLYVYSLCKQLRFDKDLHAQVIFILKELEYKFQNKVLPSLEPKFIDPVVIQNGYSYYDLINHNKNMIKILINYIKPSFLYKSAILTPIHLGRVVAMYESKDGFISTEDLKWLLDNCIGDDDFDGNISNLNRRVGFLTGTYWAWKNYAKLGSPEYFGSFGYRRLFAWDFLNNLTEYDLFIPEKRILNSTIKKQFIDFHGEELYEATLNLFKKVYPDEYLNLIEYLKQDKGYYYEIYVMKKDLFFNFCKWIFKLLFKYMEIYNSHFIQSINSLNVIKGDNETNKSELRDVAFIMERLTGYFLYKMTKDINIKYKEVEVFLTEKKSKCNKDKIFAQLRNNINMKREHACQQ